MPVYDFACAKCGHAEERYLHSRDSPFPYCCGEVMTRRYGGSGLKVKMRYPGWVDRIDEIHKAQRDRGERLRLVQPWEVGATTE